MAQHRLYWTCSKFADWLRGTPKPGSATSRGWRDWEKEAKAKHPWRYWLADTGLGHLQDFVTWPTRKLYDLRCYINNRWIIRSHSLTANPLDIRPGSWCEVGSRFLPCLFNELVDFVEIQLASRHIDWADKEEKEKYQKTCKSARWLRRRSWRCPQAGLDNLNWQSSLRFDEEWMSKDDPRFSKPTLQAETAMEIIALYKWWTETRPKRPDPMNESGWSAICERRHETHKYDGFMWEDYSANEKQESKLALELCQKIEDAYEKEDEVMMIRLIKVRHWL